MLELLDRDVGAVPAGDDLAALEAKRDVHRGEPVQPLREPGRIDARAREEVDLPGSVRGRHDDLAVEVRERLLQTRCLSDRRLAVIGEEHDGVALEELIRPARRVEDRADRRVGLLERALGRFAVRAGGMRGEVVAGEVVREEVEAVARHQPAAHGRRIRVDRAGTTAANGEGRARPVRLEEPVEEEALRPVHGTLQPRQHRQIAVPAAIARDVHRAGDEPGILERLVDRGRVFREVPLVHVEDRVDQRLRESRCAQGGEGRAVLDDPALPPLPPDHRGDAVHARPGAGRDRGEADRRERREDRGRLPVVAVLGEVRESRRASAVDRSLECRRGHPVDDDEHELPRHAPGLLVPRECSQTCVPLGLRPPEPRGEGGQRESLDVADHRDPRQRGDDQRSARDEQRGTGPRRAPAERASDDLERAQRAGKSAEDAGETVAPATRLPTLDPEADARTYGSAHDDRGDPRGATRPGHPREENADRGTQARTDPDPVPRSHAGTVTAGASRPLFAQMASDQHPLLVFFTSRSSGPARRMESLLAHIARKERGRLRVSKVDVDDRPDLAERFRVEKVPSLALVVEKRVVSRLDGRATAPRIESMLEPHLADEQLAV